MQHKITIHENLTLATNLVSTNYTDSDMVRPKMGKCAVLGKKRPSAGSQFLFSNVFFLGGVLNGVLIGILVYLSDGTNISN